MTHTVAFVGTGPDPENPDWGNSAAMAYRHAPGYAEHESCEIVACADLVREHAEAFADRFDIDDDHVYEDYEEMLAETDPTFVSIATPVPTHAPLALGCIRGGVDAIHCEKPMATTWGDARLMAQEAWRNDVQLTFNHQRRFSEATRYAKELVDDGEIGQVERVEVSCGELLDNGTHGIDLANLFVGESRVEWILGNVDYREEHVKYGAHNENHGLAHWKYENGVHGIAATGVGSDLAGGLTRVVGTEGAVEVFGQEPVRVRRGGAWETPDVEGSSSVTPAIRHVVDCYEDGVEPDLSARHALRATEVIFGAYESARERGRVDCPLRTDDNPLEAMVESGELTPEPAHED